MFENHPSFSTKTLYIQNDFFGQLLSVELHLLGAKDRQTIGLIALGYKSQFQTRMAERIILTHLCPSKSETAAIFEVRNENHVLSVLEEPCDNKIIY